MCKKFIFLLKVVFPVSTELPQMRKKVTVPGSVSGLENPNMEGSIPQAMNEKD